MQINDLKLNTRKKKRKTIGRGGKKGTYCGKGNKGQKARSGAHVDPLFEGGRSTLIDHMKKKKGFKSLNIKPMIVSLGDIEKKFKAGDVISIDSLKKTGLVGKIERNQKIKILANGKISKSLSFDSSVILSKSAVSEIEKSGGKIINDQKAKNKEQ